MKAYETALRQRSERASVHLPKKKWERCQQTICANSLWPKARKRNGKPIWRKRLRRKNKINQTAALKTKLPHKLRRNSSAVSDCRKLLIRQRVNLKQQRELLNKN